MGKFSDEEMTTLYVQLGYENSGSADNDDLIFGLVGNKLLSLYFNCAEYDEELTGKFGKVLHEMGLKMNRKETINFVLACAYMFKVTCEQFIAWKALQKLEKE